MEVDGFDGRETFPKVPTKNWSPPKS